MPRIGQSQVVRSNWYDRNPLVINHQYHLNVAPHGSTIRWTYTVPANRVFKTGILLVATLRNSVAGTNNSREAAITLNQADVADGTIINLISRDNVAGDIARVVSGGEVFFEAGSILRGITIDISIGGSVIFTVSLTGTEFDA